jgi:hypothetical protein
MDRHATFIGSLKSGANPAPLDDYPYHLESIEKAVTFFLVAAICSMGLIVGSLAYMLLKLASSSPTRAPWGNGKTSIQTAVLRGQGCCLARPWAQNP